MCYILNMNKDVIYVEPEDDITDIITKIENAKEKIVALVPPKKASVFRSVVNIKLINKAGVSADKKIVLVTTDPSVVKLAAVAKLPVTKNLQTAPVVPEVEGAAISTTSEAVVEKEGGEVKAEDTEVAADSDESSDDSDVKDEVSDDEADDSKSEAEAKETADEKESKGADKADAAEADKKDADKNPEKKKKDKSKNWFLNHLKLCIGCGVGLVVLILVGIWMFVLAPAVDITVTIRTTDSNFSENTTFVTKLQEENASEGKFYIEEKKQENKSEVEFEATGQKNVGEKAKGDLVVTAYFSIGGGFPKTIAVNKGDTFTNGDLTFIADEDTTYTWTAQNDVSACDNKDASAADFMRQGCFMSKRIAVTAENPGTKYNIEPIAANWHANAGFTAYSTNAMTGGSDKMVTVVSQEDIDKALGQLKTSSEQAYKEKLYDSINKDRAIIIDASFSQTVSDPSSTPALGEEVKDNKKAKLAVTTTDTVSFIDKTKVEEFIATKAKLNESFKIYEINEPYVDNFTKTENGFTGKLKAIYVSGPKITESDIVEIAKGKGLGTAQHELSSIDGVSKITIDPSYSWVNSVPNNTEKITVSIKVDSGKGEQ